MIQAACPDPSSLARLRTCAFWTAPSRRSCASNHIAATIIDGRSVYVRADLATFSLTPTKESIQ
jgi:hypothetical protein